MVLIFPDVSLTSWCCPSLEGRASPVPPSPQNVTERYSVTSKGKSLESSQLLPVP